MDRLEDFIKKNREDLDIYDPDPAIWGKVRKEVGHSSRPLLKWIAAAVLIIILPGTALLFYMSSGKNSEEYASARTRQNELKETEIFYSTVVNSLYREAEPFLTKEPEIQKELFNDMARIDSICSEIRKDLKDNLANQEVIEALVQNYRIKIRILEDMLNILKDEDDVKLNEKKNEI